MSISHHVGLVATGKSVEIKHVKQVEVPKVRRKEVIDA